MIKTDFTYKVYVPTHKKYYRFKTFDNSFYMVIAKQIQNNDDETVQRLFSELITNSCADKLDQTTLTRVDIFSILLMIRVMSVSDVFQFETTVSKDKEKLKHSVSLDLYDILNDVVNHEMNGLSTVRFDEGYKLVFGIPRELVNSESEHVLVDVMESLIIGKDKYDLSRLTAKEKMKVLDEMPGDCLARTIEYIKNMDTKYRIPLFKKNTLGLQENVKNMQLKMFDNSFYEFLKLMYNCNLEEQYYIRYVMVKHMSFDLHQIEYITPNDTQTYINMYRKEIDEQSKANEKSQKQGNSMSLPDPGFAAPGG